MLLTETAWKTSEAERSCGWVFHRPEVKRAEPPTEPAAELALGSAIQLWMESTGLSHPHCMHNVHTAAESEHSLLWDAKDTNLPRL